MLEHGGRLRAAAQHWGRPLAEWLDLSTGINPHAYPVPALAADCWRRLPEEGDGLEEAAAAYYGNEHLLPLPGSQAAIPLLPALFPPAAVACISPLYEEHPEAWRRAGHKVRQMPGANLARVLSAATPYVLVCNPNNPTGHHLQRDALLSAAQQLKARGGWLIVDEAFGDAEPGQCLAPFAGTEAAPNLIVLRSLGKFFGLAGARVGFMFGAAEKLERMRAALGPWPISGPARAVAKHALQDAAWQAQTRLQLSAASARLLALLSPLAGTGDIKCTALFATLQSAHAGALHEYLAHHAILTRCFPAHGLLRFGLPGVEGDWRRLEQALAEWKIPC